MTSSHSSSRHPQQERVAGDARVRDEHLDRTVLGLDGDEGGLDVVGVGHVAADAE